MAERSDADWNMYWREVERRTEAIRTNATSVGRIAFGFGRIERTASWPGAANVIKPVSWKEKVVSTFGSRLTTGPFLNAWYVLDTGLITVQFDYDIAAREIGITESWTSPPMTLRNGHYQPAREEVSEVRGPEENDFSLLLFELERGAHACMNTPDREMIYGE